MKYGNKDIKSVHKCHSGKQYLFYTSAASSLTFVLKVFKIKEMDILGLGLFCKGKGILHELYSV